MEAVSKAEWQVDLSEGEGRLQPADRGLRLHVIRLDIEVTDRFGNPVVPREWFLVPVFAIDESVERIKDGTITEYRYDPKMAALVKVAS